MHAPDTYPVRARYGVDTPQLQTGTRVTLQNQANFMRFRGRILRGRTLRGKKEAFQMKVAMPKSYRWDIASAIFGISRHHRAWLGSRNEGNPRPKGAGTPFMPRTGLYMCMHRHSVLFHGVMSGGLVHQRCILQRVAPPAPHRAGNSSCRLCPRQWAHEGGWNPTVQRRLPMMAIVSPNPVPTLIRP